MKVNVAIATVIFIGIIVQLAAMVTLAAYAPLWIAIPLILLMIVT